MKHLFNTSKELRIALISDELTSLALSECSANIFQVKDKNWFQLFKIFKPDFILVESCIRRGYRLMAL